MSELEVATDFRDLLDTMSQEQINKLASVYNHVDDIDLFIAGLMETPASGSLLGPTFSYIIANQVIYADKSIIIFLSVRMSHFLMLVTNVSHIC